MKILPLLPLHLLAELEILRGSTATVYCTNDRSPRNLTTGDTNEFARVLSKFSRPAQLDFVLHTEGGLITAARTLALQLRNSAPRMDVLVPGKARSAGTLICLAANELVVGPLAEFSPIDPVIRSESEASAGHPRRISSEDIRCFREMAENWFDLRSEESRLHVFGLLNQRFFPTTLSAFFRADQYVRKVGNELLEFQLPQVSVEQRKSIVNNLVVGYSSHQDPIGSREMLKFGLNARATSDAEAKLLEQIIGETQKYLSAVDRHAGALHSRCRAAFFTRYSGIQFVSRGGGTSVKSESPEEEVSEAISPGHAGKWEDIDLSEQASL